MQHRTRVKLDAIRAIMRDCSRIERDHIFEILKKENDPTIATIDRAAVERALADANGHVGQAADMLAVGRRTLQKKMREYGMPAGMAGRKSRFV